MKLLRFFGLLSFSYVTLMVTYLFVVTIVAFYEQAPEGNRLTALATIFQDSGLSIFRDSARWIVGPEGLYSFIPTLQLIQSAEIFRELPAHIFVQLVAFGFLGFLAVSRGCSLTVTLLLPVLLSGLTASLMQGRLLALTHFNLTAVLIVIAAQVVGLFLGSVVYTIRLK